MISKGISYYCLLWKKCSFVLSKRGRHVESNESKRIPVPVYSCVLCSRLCFCLLQILSAFLFFVLPLSRKRGTPLTTTQTANVSRSIPVPVVRSVCIIPFVCEYYHDLCIFLIRRLYWYLVPATVVMTMKIMPTGYLHWYWWPMHLPKNSRSSLGTAIPYVGPYIIPSPAAAAINLNRKKDVTSVRFLTSLTSQDT